MKDWEKIKAELQAATKPDESLWVTQALMERRAKRRHPPDLEWLEGVALVVGCILLVAFLVLGGPLLF